MKELAYRFADALNTKDLAAFDDFIVAGYVNHNPYAAPGRAGMKAFFTNWLEAFPDYARHLGRRPRGGRSGRGTIHVSGNASRGLPPRLALRCAAHGTHYHDPQH